MKMVKTCVKKISKYILLFLAISYSVSCTKSIFRIPAQSDPEIHKIDVNSLGWMLTFQDEFETADVAISKGAPKDCFEGPTSCLYHAWKRKDCTAEDNHVGLKDLNRCHWTVWGMYNWMDYEAPLGQGINSFHPSQVKIKDGKLILSAKRSNIPVSQIDCKNEYKNPDYDNDTMLTTKCLAISGGVQSGPYWRNNREVGIFQEYGRFEVRAKVSNGPGAWPAIWMLPSSHPIDEEEAECGWWPYRGEIDIMEFWEKSPNKVTVSYHDGNCKKRVKTNANESVKANATIFPYISKSKLDETYFKDFHTYAVEWESHSIRFFIDDYLVHSVFKDEPLEAKHFEGTQHGKDAGEIPSEIARGAFHLLLNNTISTDSMARWKQFPLGSTPGNDLDHIIEYVRVYKRCSENDDPKNCYKPNYRNTYGVAKNESQKVYINAYPNPVFRGNKISVSVSSKFSCNNFEMLFISFDGKLIEKKNVGELKSDLNHYFEFDTDHLSSGAYIVQASYKNCASFENASFTSFLILVQ